jgi:hypothetical protein
MKTATLQNVLAATYQSAAEMLAEALPDLECAARAAQEGNLALARGAAMPSTATVARLRDLLTAIEALSGLTKP